MAHCSCGEGYRALEPVSYFDHTLGCPALGEPFSRRPMFVVDWDDTCVVERREDGSLYWPEMGPWIPGAVDALRRLSSLGRTVIYSLRTHYYEMDDHTPRPRGASYAEELKIRAMLKDSGLGHIQVYPGDRGKPPALFYIDNRGLRFEGDWTPILERVMQEMTGEVRVFESGATRDVEEDKLDFEGFLSPRVIQRFAEYMHANRVQSDGSLRDSDNWQKGFPLDSTMKSGWRHFFDWWCNHRGIAAREDIETAICGLIFNAQSYLDEVLKAKEREEAA